MLQAMSEDELSKDLIALGLSIGARRKIIKGLEQNANAAKKAAVLQAAEKQMEAAALKQERDDLRIKNLREQVKRLGNILKPPELVCPISHELMCDPVFAADGHSYERADITEWLKGHNTSPLTGEALANTQLTPSHAMRGLVQRFVDSCNAAGVDPDSVSEQS